MDLEYAFSAAIEDGLFDDFSKLLFTESERKNLEQRWVALQAVNDGLTHRKICDEYDIAKATVQRAASALSQNRVLMEKILQTSNKEY